MGIRYTSEQVLAELEQGHSRREIYNRLTQNNPKDAGKIAYCIASIPEKALRKKYIHYNAILCILLVIYSILNVISGLPIDPDEPTLFLVLMSTVPLVFSYFVYRFHGGIYRLTGYWFLLDLLETVLFTGAPDGVAVLKLFTLFFITTLSFSLARKVFPGLGVLGPKKDESGHYYL